MTYDKICGTCALWMQDPTAHGCGTCTRRCDNFGTCQYEMGLARDKPKNDNCWFATMDDFFDWVFGRGRYKNEEQQIGE